MRDLIRAVPVPLAATDATERFDLNFETFLPNPTVERVCGWRAALKSKAVAVLWVRDRAPENMSLESPPRSYDQRVCGIKWRWDEQGMQPLPDGLGALIGQFAAFGDTWLVFRVQAPPPASSAASAPRTPATPQSPRAPAAASTPGDAARRAPSPAAPGAAHAPSAPGTARSTGAAQVRPQADTSRGPTPRPHQGPSSTTRQERK